MRSIAEVLQTAKTIAVVGLSSRRFRASYGVSEYMQSVGYRIIPVNPNETEILGEKVYGTLDEVPGEIDIVNVFRSSEYVPEIVEAAIRKKATTVWLQEGIEHTEAEETARRAGLSVISDRCILKEHRKLKINECQLDLNGGTSV